MEILKILFVVVFGGGFQLSAFANDAAYMEIGAAGQFTLQRNVKLECVPAGLKKLEATDKLNVVRESRSLQPSDIRGFNGTLECYLRLDEVVDLAGIKDCKSISKRTLEAGSVRHYVLTKTDVAEHTMYFDFSQDGRTLTMRCKDAAITKEHSQVEVQSFVEAARRLGINFKSPVDVPAMEIRGATQKSAESPSSAVK